MKNPQINYFTALLLGLLMFACSSSAPNEDLADTTTVEASKPNIVYIMIDDIGVISIPSYSDNLYNTDTARASDNIGYVSDSNAEGGFTEYTTPNISQLASESLVFTNMYSTPLCAPSRGQLVTGLYPFQTGVIYPAFSGNTPTTPNPPGQGPLNPSYTTYPKLLRDSSNYYTGFGGKWNLRFGIPDNGADRQTDYATLVAEQKTHLQACGFDNTFAPDALIGHTIDYYPPQLQNQQDTLDNEYYLPYAINQWAQGFIDEAKTKDQPFYLHYCLGLIHNSSDPQQYDSKTGSYEGAHSYGKTPPPGYPNGTTDTYANFANKIHIADSLIGVIINKIQSDTTLSKNTIIVVAGDNGTERKYTTKFRGVPTQGAKFTLHSRGSNVPFIVHWPGMINIGKYSELADFTDVHPTMTQIAGVNAPSVKTSGFSFLNNIQLPASSRTPTRSYVYCQADNIGQHATIPDSVINSQIVTGNNAFIANKEYSLIPTPEGGALFSINPETLLDSFLCGNGCKDTPWESIYDELYIHLCGLDLIDVPYDKTAMCNTK